MRKTIKQKGFTLVELLVVIAIIGIIGVVIMANFNDSRARARDSRRVSDIKSFNSALAIYATQNGRYPNPTGGLVMPPLPGLIINGTDWVSQMLKNANILGSDLIDPNDGRQLNGEIFHYYYFTDANGRNYTITYCLETASIFDKSAGCGNTESQ